MKTEKIIYSANGERFEGVLVFDPAGGKRPGVLMAPNWMGVDGDAVACAQKIATEGGYSVFVADMYGVGKRPTNHPEAAALANPLRAAPLEIRSRITAAFETLIAEAGARGVLDADRLAAIGFCFGGGNVLDLVRSGAKAQAVVSIHGDLATPMPAQPGDIEAAVLAIHGAADPVAPKAQRDGFETEMDTAGCRWRMHVFGGVVHSFTDEGVNVPGIAVHDEKAARATFKWTYEFIQDAFDDRV